MGIRVLDFSDGFTSATTPTESGGTSMLTLQTLENGDTIALGTSSTQLIKVVGDGGAVTLSTTPFGLTPPDTGTTVTITGTNSVNTVTITHNDAADGCILNGDVTLGSFDSVTLIYDASVDRYLELSRNF